MKAGHERESQDDFVAHHLAGRANAAKQRVLVVRRVARDGGTDDAGAGDREDEENADVDARNLHRNRRARDLTRPRQAPRSGDRDASCSRKWDYGERGDGRDQRDDRAAARKEACRPSGDEVLFEDELQGVGQRVEQTDEHDLALVADDHGVNAVAHAEQNRRDAKAAMTVEVSVEVETVSGLLPLMATNALAPRVPDRDDTGERRETPKREPRLVDQRHDRGRRKHDSRPARDRGDPGSSRSVDARPR